MATQVPDGTLTADLFGALREAGAALTARGGELVSALWLPTALVLVAVLASRLRRPGSDGGAAHLLAALGIAGCAQAAASTGSGWAACALYAVACAAWWVRRPPPAAVSAGSGAGPAIWLAGAALLALYALFATHALPVFPDLYFDEVAYLRAARMHAGAIPHGPVLVENGVEIYNLAQFRAQPIPLWLHRLAIATPEGGVLALRVASVAAVGVSLGVTGAAALRGLGAAGVGWMLALAACSPLLLTYARMGQYMSVSVLHASLCFAALVHLLRRWSAPAAALLGALLGASLYCYQLSWFVPLLIAACAASVGEVWSRAGAGRLAGITAATALAVSLPGLSMQEELRAVTAQTFDRAVWNRIDPGGERAALVVLPRQAGDTDVAAAVALLAEAGVAAVPERSSAERRILTASGPADALDAGAALADARGWDLVRDPWQEYSAAGRVAAAVRQLFAGPVAESAGRWIDGSLLGPLLAPLAVLGLVEALRRRRELLPRLLGVWVALAALLPAVVGGVVPRRTVLALPFVFGLMALPLREIGAALAARGGVAGRLRWPGALLLWCAVAATGTSAYFDRWDQRIGVPSHDQGVLAFLELVDRLPPDEVVLFPSFFSRNQQVLLRERRAPDAAVYEMVPTATTPADVRAASCARPTPFVWLTLEEPDQTARFERLGDDFLFRRETRGGFALFHVTLRKPEGCRDAPTAIRAPGHPGAS